MRAPSWISQLGTAVCNYPILTSPSILARHLLCLSVSSSCWQCGHSVPLPRHHSRWSSHLPYRSAPPIWHSHHGPYSPPGPRNNVRQARRVRPINSHWTATTVTLHQPPKPIRSGNMVLLSLRFSAFTINSPTTVH